MTVATLGLSISEWLPQHELAWCGGAILLFVPVGVAWAILDRRTVGGEALALKPIRFALSIGVYMLTASWMFSYVRPERFGAVAARAAVWALIIGCAVEFSLIVLQAVRGRRSHFNEATASDRAIWATMGVFAVLFVGAVLPLAWEIGRHPRPDSDPIMVRAVIAGLLLTFLLGGGTGGLIGRRSTHSVGPEGRTLPLFGWTLRSGDIRIPHFFGIHAMQALPLIAAAARWLQPQSGGVAATAGALGYALFTAVLIRQALRGRPPLPGITRAPQ